MTTTGLGTPHAVRTQRLLAGAHLPLLTHYMHSWWNAPRLEVRARREDNGLYRVPEARRVAAGLVQVREGDRVECTNSIQSVTTFSSA